MTPNPKPYIAYTDLLLLIADHANQRVELRPVICLGHLLGEGLGFGV